MSSLSVSEKFGLVFRLALIVPFKLLFNLSRTSYVVRQRRLPSREFITVALIRVFLTSLTPRQIIAISPGTTATYNKWATQAHGDFIIETETTLLNDHITKLHWVKHPTNPPQKVVLFFHGGGYNAPLTPGHLDWCLSFVNVGLSINVPIAVAILEYQLCPLQQYPFQLRQARNALHHLLSLGFKSEDIIMGGDSAGGNLAIGLLSHLMYPHPEVEALHVPKPLAGAFLVSPWVTNDKSTLSFRQNASIDMLSPGLVQRSARDFLPMHSFEKEAQKGEGWALGLNARPGWWDQLNCVVKGVHISTGDQEMFRDHVVQFAEILKQCAGQHGVDVHLDLGLKEAHDHILTLFMRKAHKNRPWEDMRTWLISILMG